MTNSRFHQHKGICAITIAGALFMSTGLHAEEKLPASEKFSERTKEFLSDPSRTGSLVGSIIAGAAVANPLAPLLGSVAGFMIGKSSAFTQKDDGSAARRQAYNNRSLMPNDGSEVIGLAGLTGDSPPQRSEETLILGAANPADADAPSLPESAEQVVIVKFPGETGISGQRRQAGQVVKTEFPDMSEGMEARIALQKQLAYSCSNVQLAQSTSPSCYYYSQ